MSELKKTIYVSRSFTLNRSGHDPVQLVQGRNIVDAAVAAHPYVKAHLTDAVASAGDAAVQERIADMEQQLADASQVIAGQSEALRLAGEENTSLEQQLAQVKADMQAMAEAYATPTGKKK